MEEMLKKLEDRLDADNKEEKINKFNDESEKSMSF